jgi:mRNA-degrading endonuclease toxin of MazEF toxin-antitoxin module
MERGDIYLVSLDPSSDHEQQGRRPVLVVTPGKFNKVTGVPVVLPITSGGNFARTIGFAVSLSGAGTKQRASCAATNRAHSICAPERARSWNACRKQL